MKRLLKRALQGYIAPFIIFLMMLFCGYTQRIRIIGKENNDFMLKNGCIVALWHCHLFYVPFHLRWRKRFYVLVSPSSDGDIMDGMLRLLGFFTVRGSTHENPRSSLLGMARRLKKEREQGAAASMVADGSRGPARKSQPGSVFLAKLTGLPIVPIAYEAEKGKRLRTWDKTLFPYPFTRITVAVGSPIYIDDKADSEELMRKNLELENELNRLTETAASSFPS